MLFLFVISLLIGLPSRFGVGNSVYTLCHDGYYCLGDTLIKEFVNFQDCSDACLISNPDYRFFDVDSYTNGCYCAITCNLLQENPYTSTYSINNDQCSLLPGSESQNPSQQPTSSLTWRNTPPSTSTALPNDANTLRLKSQLIIVKIVMYFLTALVFFLIVVIVYFLILRRRCSCKYGLVVKEEPSSQPQMV